MAGTAHCRMAGRCDSGSKIQARREVMRRLRSTILPSPRTDHPPGNVGSLQLLTAAGGLGVVGASKLTQELVALVRPGRVLFHHLTEEVGDLLLVGVLGVTHVLPVVVTRLQ